MDAYALLVIYPDDYKNKTDTPLFAFTGLTTFSSTIRNQMYESSYNLFFNS